ncbi:MAG: response regulator transcription factor [Clostridia bacterium]|nr:response regulator transcription factor [Clostridia bacterium]
MIHITICDDDSEIIAACKAFAERYETEQRHHLDWRFLMEPKKMDPEELAKEDIVILDIQMDTWNGIDLAREIRRYNENNIIIFSTNYLEYALQGYEVAAFRYLKKPIGYDQFSKVLSEAVEQHLKSAQASIVLRCGYQMEQFRIAEIMYCETERGHVRITLQDGTVALANAGISTLEDEFRDYAFFRCHKGCLVNLHYVKQPRKTDVVMKNGATIPVSKHRMKEFMLALMKHWGGQLR